MSPLTLEQLTRALREGGQLDQGTVSHSHQTLRPSDGAMSELFELELEYSSNSRGAKPERCLLKVVAPPMFRAGQGEVGFYRWLGKQEQRPAVLIEPYGTLLDEEQQLAAVLMEDRGRPVAQPEWPIPAPMAQCRQSVAALAEVHARWWGDTTLIEVAASRPPPQRDIARLNSCGSALVDRLGDALSTDRRELLATVIANYPQQHEARLAGSGCATIVHGDAHQWNFHASERNQATLALIDWQLWHVDFGVADLAYMLALHWFPERRRRYEAQLLAHYVELINAKGHVYTLDQCRSDYRFMVAGLLTKVAIYASVLPANIWWPHLERAFMAFADLDCAALIDG